LSSQESCWGSLILSILSWLVVPMPIAWSFLRLVQVFVHFLSEGFNTLRTPVLLLFTHIFDPQYRTEVHH
jgi:hypothetical protein